MLEESVSSFEEYGGVKVGLLEQKDSRRMFPSVSLSIRFLDSTLSEPDGIHLTITSEKISADEHEGIAAYIMYTDESGEVVDDHNGETPVPPTDMSLSKLLADIPRLMSALKDCVISRR